MLKKSLLVLLTLGASMVQAAEFYVVVPVKGRALTAAQAAQLSVELTPGELPSGARTQAYTYDLKTNLLVTGDPSLDTTQASWSISALPAGLSLSGAGVLLGTPQVVGVTNFEATATYKGKSASQLYQLSVTGYTGSIGFDQSWVSSYGDATLAGGVSLSSMDGQVGTGSLLSSTSSTTGGGSVKYSASLAQLGAGDFTVEVRGYRTYRNGAYSGGLLSLPIPGNTLEIMVDDVTSGQAYPSFAIAGGTYATKGFQVPLNQWVTYKLERRNTKVRFYINDVQMPIHTYNTGYSDDYTNTSVNEITVPTALNPTSIIVGNRSSLSRQWRGYVDNVRIVLE